MTSIGFFMTQYEAANRVVARKRVSGTVGLVDMLESSRDIAAELRGEDARRLDHRLAARGRIGGIIEHETKVPL